MHVKCLGPLQLGSSVHGFISYVVHWRNTHTHIYILHNLSLIIAYAGSTGAPQLGASCWKYSHFDARFLNPDLATHSVWARVATLYLFVFDARAIVVFFKKK